MRTIPMDETLHRMIRGTPREVETLVAEIVCGWTKLPYEHVWVERHPNYRIPPGILNPKLQDLKGVPAYLSDASAAMKVVEAMRLIGWSIECHGPTIKDPQFYIRFGTQSESIADSVSESFCHGVILAALAAVRDAPAPV